MPVLFSPMSETNPSHEPTLKSLSEINRLLRQQVVDLLLSIAILKETEVSLVTSSVPEPVMMKTGAGNE